MRRLLKSGSDEPKVIEDTELKKKVSKEVQNRQDDVAYLKNRLAIEENTRESTQQVLMKLVQCKANLERIEDLEKKVEQLEKRVSALQKK